MIFRLNREAREAKLESLKASNEAKDAQHLVDEFNVEREALQKKIDEQVDSLSRFSKEVEGAKEESLTVAKEMVDTRHLADEINVEQESLQKKNEEQFETMS